MLKSTIFPANCCSALTKLLTLGILAAALAGCDTQVTQGTQDGDEVSSETVAADLTGIVDRTFAGSNMPGVTVTDTSGITLELDQLRGTPVLLNLWATWCAPCIVEMPLLDDLAGELGADVRVLTVSEDIGGAEVVAAFLAERNFANLPAWIDGNNELASAFGGGTVLPLTIMYDAGGQELWRVIGAFDWGSAEANELVQEAVTNED